MGFLEQWAADGLRDPDLLRWLERFRADKFAAARDYWQAVREGIHAAFQAGAGAIPDNFTPGQKGAPES